MNAKLTHPQAPLINCSRSTFRRIFSPAARARLEAGFGLKEDDLPEAMTPEALVAQGRPSDIMISSWGCTSLSSDVLAGCPNLRLLIHGAGTLKYVMTPEARDAGLRVTTGVAVNARPVAEFCLGVFLTALKEVVPFREAFHDPSRRSAIWRQTPNTFTGGYYGKKIGIVGLGEISRYLCKLLQNFDFEVLLASRYLDEETSRDLRVKPADLNEILSTCDLVSIHSADTPANRNLLNADNLPLLRPGAILVNTARGKIIEETALIARLRQGDLWAYLDVTAEEPPADDHPFYSLPNCVLTPHISGSIGAETYRLGDFCLRELDNFRSGKPLEHEFNLSLLDFKA
jgi:phosphoglycerate dehydrogenase-like enzyme